jgi:chromosome segregation ATPase
LAAGVAQSQTQRAGSTPNAQVMQQLEQLATERTQLQAENARLTRELENTKKQLRSLQADRDSLARKSHGSETELSRLTASNETLNRNVADQRARMDELVAKFRETLANLRDVETDRSGAKSQLAARERELSTCVEHNLALYRINGEVLDRLEHQGFWTSVAKTEPFTRLKRTEIENLVDAYRDRARDQQVGPAAKEPTG